MKKTVLLVFISVLLLSLVHGARFTSSASMDQIAGMSSDSMSLAIDWSHYHNYTEIVDILLSLNATYPDVVDVFSIGRSWQNRSIYCVRLTNENATYPKPKTLFVGYHHARERITAELPLYFVVYAAENYGVNATITRMLDLSEIYVVVALNVDGFDAVDVNEWQRKNVHPFDEDGDGLLDEDPPDDEDNDGFIEWLYPASPNVSARWEGVDDDGDGLFNEDWVGGVDLNRNYGYEWNASVESGSPYPQDQVYRGPSPFSEPETQAMRDLALQHDFKYAISFHSGADIILYPWGYTTNPTPDDQKFREIARDMAALVNSSHVQSMYTTSGGWGDWMYGNRNVFALTCEIYENNSAWQYEHGPDYLQERGVFQYFNPDPDLIESTLLRWMPIFTYVSDRAIHDWIIVPDGYATIQAAINAANSGATIFVRAGTYYENVVVNKTVSLVGEGKETTVIDGNMSGTVVRVTASGVFISNFTIRNSGDYRGLDSGVKVEAGNCNVTDNLITNNLYGVLLSDSPNSTVSGNVMNGNKYSFGVEGVRLSDFMLSVDASNLVDGKPVYYLVNQKDLVINPATYPQVGYLALINCTNVTVEGLTLANNRQGLLLAYTNNSRITGNNVTNNEYGILLVHSSNNSIAGNTFVNDGLFVSNSYGNEVYDNLVNDKPLVYLEDVSDYAVEDAGQVILVNCSRIQVENLDLSNTTVGVQLWETNSTKIAGNNITNNLIGVSLLGSHNQIYHNNFIENEIQVEIKVAFTGIPFPVSNVWSNGYPSGGNYWSDHTGVDMKSGSYQNEDGSDGIIDRRYQIDADNRDKYPFMGPISFFNAGTWNETTYYVHTSSNSTISDFHFSEDDKLVSFNVTGPEESVGFCRVAIPKKLMWSDVLEDWNVTVDDNPPIYLKAMEDADYTYLYFTYSHTIRNVKITSTHVIGEFPPPAEEIVPFWTQWWFWAIAATGIIVFAGAVYLLKKKKPPTPTAQTSTSYGYS